MTLLFLIVTGLSCDFQTAFSKGAEDVKVQSYGANLDRYCDGASEEDRRAFTRAYILGRENGTRLQEANLTKIPSNEEQLRELIAESDKVIEAKALQAEMDAKDAQINQQKRRLDRQNRAIMNLESELKKAKSPY